MIACPMNVLHVWDYKAPYDNYDALHDYPGHIVNCNVKLSDHQISGQCRNRGLSVMREISRPFGASKPFDKAEARVRSRQESQKLKARS